MTESNDNTPEKPDFYLAIERLGPQMFIGVLYMPSGEREEWRTKNYQRIIREAKKKYPGLQNISLGLWNKTEAEQRRVEILGENPVSKFFG